MKRVRIRMPAEATVDPSALASAVRMVMAGGMADAKLWRPNTVPAIGQLEEGAYGEGVSALADLFDGMVRVLALPEDPLAKALLPDTTEPELTAEIAEDLAKALRLSKRPPPGQTGFDFDEEEHPREAAGGSLPGYKPGEFVPKSKTQAQADEAAKTEDEPVQEDETTQELPDTVAECQARRKQIGEALGQLQPTGDKAADRAREARLFKQLNRLGEHEEGLVAGFNQQLDELRAAYEEEQNQRQVQLRATSKLMGEVGPDLKANLKEQLTDLHDEFGIAMRRQVYQEDRLRDLRDGRETVPLPDEMREKGRDLIAQDKALSRALVPLSDPQRVTLKAEIRRLFQTADVMESRHGEYLQRQVMKVMQAASKALDPILEERKAATTEAEKDAVQEKINALSDRTAEEAALFEDRADWARQYEQEKADRELLDEVGPEEFARIKREAAEAKEYLAKHPKGYGYDRRQQPRPETEDSHKAVWKPLGSFWSDAACEAKNLPLGTRNLTEQEHTEAREAHYIGDGFFYRGPATATRQLTEARKMMGRIQKKFPQWLRDHLRAKGVENHFTVTSPMRIDMPTQAEFYTWLTQNHTLVNGANPDLSGGVYYHSHRNAYSQIGNSHPDTGNQAAGLGGSGCVNVESHEYAHAVDYNFRDDGQPVSSTPEWEQIARDMDPYVNTYMQRRHELFAEGLACFLYSPELRKQMLEGPGPWRRMGEFFQEFVRDPSRPAPKQRKAVKKALFLYKSQPTAEPEDETEGGQPGIPAGWVWQPYEMPAPNGDGVILVDGWGPPHPDADPEKGE